MVFCVETGEDNVPFIQLGSYMIRLDLEDLNKSDKERAAEELRECPENVQFGLTQLREMIGTEVGLHVPLDDEAFLLKFLRPCKFYPENAFKIMKKFYKLKMKHPKYGFNLTPKSVRHVFDNEVFSILPTRSSSGGRIMVINCGTKWDPKVVKIEEMLRALIVVTEIAMLEPRTQLGGIDVILDMEGLSLVHIYQFSPQIAKHILDWVQECAPVRLKGLHVINQPYLFGMIFAIFKPFLGEKLKRCVFFHGANRKSLTEKISVENLPECYGGTADIPEWPGSLFSELLFFYEKDFEVSNTYGYITDK